LGDSGEYLFWNLFHVPWEQLRIEWIVAGTASEKYKPDDFTPCAVICQDCGSETPSIRGLDLYLVESDFALYMNPKSE
jgi:hypothetical protein